jgi:hypothetical protein
MADGDLQQKVESWLNKTGYPLEMRVARAFRGIEEKIAWYSEANTTYYDPETGTTREVDLRAFCMPTDSQEDGITISVDMDLECKSTTTPWVILRESFRPQPIHPLIDIGGYTMHCVRNQQARGQLDRFEVTLSEYLKDRLRLSPVAGYGIAEAFKDKRNNDAAYLATQQVLSVMGFTASRAFKGEKDVLGLVYLLPVIVTTSPLFEAALDSVTNEIVTRPVLRSVVNTPTHGGGGMVDVSIINEKAIESLMEDIAPFNREMQGFLKSYDRRVLNRLDGVAASTGPWSNRKLMS